MNSVGIATGRISESSKTVRFGNCAPTKAPIYIPKDCGENALDLQISLQLDQSPQDTSWDLVDDVDNKIILSGGDYRPDIDKLEKITTETCLPSDLCATFTVRDASGDGLCCFQGIGGYALYLGGKEITSGGKFDSVDRYKFCNCPADSNTFRLSLMTDEYPEETYWDLVDSRSNQILLQGGNYNGATDVQKEFFEEACIPKNVCATFTIRDTFQDGICCFVGKGYFTVSLNGKVIASGDKFGSSAIVQFGDC